MRYEDSDRRELEIVEALSRATLRHPHFDGMQMMSFSEGGHADWRNMYEKLIMNRFNPLPKEQQELKFKHSRILKNIRVDTT